MSEIQKDIGRQSKYVVVGIVGLCMTVGYLGLSYFSKNTESKSQVSGIQNNNPPTKTEETQQYSELLNEFNKQKAESAQLNGESYLSVPSSKTEAVEPVKTNDQFSQQPVQPQFQMQPEQVTTKGIDQSVLDVIALWNTESHDTARKSEDGVNYAQSLFGDQVSTKDGNVQLHNVNTKRAVFKVVEDFALVPAILDTDIDTDENSEVQASIHTGKYAGAVLYALGYKRLTNTVDMTFSFMKLNNGRSYKITAKAIDPNTGRSSLSGEVNNRYFSRIVLPAIAAGIVNAGQLY